MLYLINSKKQFEYFISCTYNLYKCFDRFLNFHIFQCLIYKTVFFIFLHAHPEINALFYTFSFSRYFTNMLQIKLSIETIYRKTVKNIKESGDNESRIFRFKIHLCFQSLTQIFISAKTNIFFSNLRLIKQQLFFKIACFFVFC